MQYWDKYEMDIATEIVNIGLAKAADSLSFFTKERVLLSGLKMRIGAISELECALVESNYHVLTTDLKGEVQGKCHLLFSESDADNFLDIALPESVKSNPDAKEEMGKEVLKEADNIITASVVTQFSNLLNINMHGYIPFHEIVPCEQMDTFLQTGAQPTAQYLLFRVSLTSASAKINPNFVWMLDDVFIEKVKEFVKTEANLLKIKSVNH